MELRLEMKERKNGELGRRRKKSELKDRDLMTEMEEDYFIA